MINNTEVHTPSSKPPRDHMVRLNQPAYEILSYLAAHRGERLVETLYKLLRHELHEHHRDTAWTPAPPPFVVRPTYDGERAVCEVLIFNPFLPSARLTGPQAVALADLIHDALESHPITGRAVETASGQRISVSRGGRHVALHVDAEHYPMAKPIAADLAASLDSASVHAGPLQKAEPKPH